MKNRQSEPSKSTYPDASNRSRVGQRNTHARRALPINKYPESPGLHGQMPGANTSAEVWVAVIAEDGTWGLGSAALESQLPRL